jgi:hypothetical protein
MVKIKMQKGLTPILVVALITVISLGVAGGVYYWNDQQKQKSINSFEECAAAGNPVMESYPAQCRIKDGRHFIQQISEEEKKKLQPPESTSSASETSNWPIYTSKKYNYQVNYNPKWEIEEDDLGNVNFYPLLDDLDYPDPTYPVISIRKVSGKSPQGNQTIDGIDMVTEWKEIEVNGLKGIYYRVYNCAPQCWTAVDFPLEDHILQIVITTEARNRGFMSIFEKMHTSFKFLE